MRLVTRIVITVLLFVCQTSANADGITGISKTNKLFSQAEEAFKAKDLKGVIKAYEEALRENTELPPQVFMNLGHAYYQVKSWNKAQKRYLEAAALTESPGFRSVAFQQLGNILFQNKNYKGSLEWYRKSLKENPENKNSRFNYELALKLLQEQEKQQPQNQKGDQQKKEVNKKENKDQPKPEKNQGQENKPDQKQSQEEKNKEQERKGGPKPGDKDKNKAGEPKPGETQQQAEQKQENGQQQKPDPRGEENQAKKDKESNMDDPESQQLDRQKLRETGLSEDQARNLLQAMRQSEVKYLQQRRFKSQKGGTSTKGKPRW